MITTDGSRIRSLFNPYDVCRVRVCVFISQKSITNRRNGQGGYYRGWGIDSGIRRHEPVIEMLIWSGRGGGSILLQVIQFNSIQFPNMLVSIVQFNSKLQIALNWIIESPALLPSSLLPWNIAGVIVIFLYIKEVILVRLCPCPCETFL